MKNGQTRETYLEQIAAHSNAGNDKLQQMAEATANIVAMTTNFKKRMEEREKQEAEKDAQIAALMQQVQLLATTMAELMQQLKGKKTNAMAGQHKEGEPGAPKRMQWECIICCCPNHKTEDCFCHPENADKKKAWMDKYTTQKHHQEAQEAAKKE